MFENMNEIMEETAQELQANEVLEPSGAQLGGETDISAEEAESVGLSDYSPEAVSNAWREYNNLSGKQREAFLRGHSRNAHIMNMELRNTRSGSSAEASENPESVGYSSDYYKHELATAKNDIQRDYALKNYRAALAKESVGAAEDEVETAEAPENAEGPEAVGYSSDYYEHRMEVALKNGNKIAYENAKDAWAKAKVRESVGYSSDYYKHELATARNDIQRDYALKNYKAALAKETVGPAEGEVETAETAEDPEAVGYSSGYYEHQMASALKNGNRIAYNNARSSWENAKRREAAGAATGEIETEAEDKEAVGYYSSSLVQRAWDEYNRLSESEREEFLRSNSRTAHVMMVELAHMKRGDPVPGSNAEAAESDEDAEAVGSSPNFWLNKATNDLAEGYTNGYKINMDRYYKALQDENK